MRLSFRANMVLGIITIACGAMSGISLWFTIPAAAAGIILLWGNIRTHKTKQADFKKKIIHEMLGITNHIVISADNSRILYPDWSSESDDSKMDLLGVGDYELCKQFYDAVEARNRYFLGRQGLGPWEDFEKLNRAIYDTFLRLCDGVSWVKELIPEATMDNLRSTAKGSAYVS